MADHKTSATRRRAGLILAMVLVSFGPLFLGDNAGALQQTLVPRGSSWRYLDGAAAPGAGWADPSYDDQLWATGAAQLGYGDGDESTLLSYGSNANAKALTAYFRLHFTVSGAAAWQHLDLGVLRDDGAVVYLNGVELRRDNLPPGAIDRTTPAVVAIGGADESLFTSSSHAATLLHDGSNVLAVEVHQSSGTSSDLSFDLELSASDGGASVTRGPYLQRGTPSGMVVRWRTDLATDSRVRFGVAVGALNSVADSATLTTEHVVTLSPLAPDSSYVYSVGTTASVLTGGDASHMFHTPPLAGTAKRVRIWVVGDAGTGSAAEMRVRDAYATFAGGASPDLWLMLGDNAYTAGTDAQYQVGVFDIFQTLLRSSVLWPTFGNHDGQSASSALQSGPYYDIFTLPAAAEAGGVASGTEAYYSYDYGRMHFVCLDSYGSSRASNGPMAQWLASDLQATSADWVIAYWHHPPYSKGSHNSDSEVELIEMRQNLLPILEAGGVDLVLSGHSHAYERSALLDGHYGVSTTLQPSMVHDARDGRIEGDGPYHKPAGGPAAHAGAVYVVAGSGANLGGGTLDHPVMITSLPVRGSLVLDIEGAVLTARFLDDAASVRDAFTITKGAVSSVNLQGSVRYYAGNRPVGGVALTAQSGTDAAGAYTVSAPVGAPLVLQPRRSGGVDGAVTALDAARVLQAVAGIRSLDAMQTLACDVTGNGTLSTLDAAEILRRAVGLTAQVPAAAACGSDLIFVPDVSPASGQVVTPPLLSGGTCQAGSIRFEPASASTSGRNFVAAVLGDCTGNWQEGTLG
ncbi:MAG: metallophosphoesterase, partial [bacterium]